MPAGAVAAGTNFQPAAAIVPLGYTADSGAAYDATRGFGWVREDSLNKPSHIGLDVSPNAVERNVHMDQRLDTFIQMEFAKGTTPPAGAVTDEAAWEMALPTADYEVTVSVGDAGPDLDSTHRVNIEGQTAIAFVPTAANRFATVTRTVRVSDGRLTLDSRGGKNTKINYVEVEVFTPPDTTPPPVPGGVSTTAGDAMVTLDWNASSASDLAGYDVYRSTAPPVSTAGAPLNGATPLTTTTFADMTVANGTTYYYVVVASDTSGNRSAPSSTVFATPGSGGEPPPIDVALNFQPASAPIPAGYIPDTGAAYSSGPGRGWLREDSLASASPVPLDVSATARDRNLLSDQRLDTFVHMELGTPAAWAMAVPDGHYSVVVSVGDAGAFFDSSHQINIEGETAIAGFVPTSANRFASATRTVHVSDGLLTVDSIGGSNTKINYIRVTGVPADTTPPAPPTGVSATPGDALVTVDWSAGSEPDLSGYDVYRSTSQPVDTSGTPLNGGTPLTTTEYIDTAVTNGTTYHYVVLAKDDAGNRSVPSSTVSATPVAGEPPPTDLQINFQPAGAPTPAGYVADTGAAYSSAAGRGWVREDSVDLATPVPLSVAAGTRDRNLLSDQLLDTFAHMQQSGTTPAAWVMAVPNGTYSVVVSVGDAGAFFDSSHQINVEGQAAISAFVPASGNQFAAATRTVQVTDGFLTIDARGGANTKINYLRITGSSDTTPPVAPANVSATPSDTRVVLAWNANTESDLDGYDIFRGTSQPVSTSGTPRNGANPLPTNTFTDTSVVNGTTYYYVVVAVDDAGNRSAPSAEVSATPQAVTPDVDKAINFQPAGAPVPTGYTADAGAAYSSATGQGWVREDSLDTTHIGLDVAPNARDRNLVADQRQDTFIHMQFPPAGAPAGAVTTPAAWELAVPPGGYEVTVGVGDAGYFDSTHRINIENQIAIAAFRPNSTDRFLEATRTVNVADGRLTIDARGGTNTKLDYVTVVSDDAAQRPAVTSTTPTDGATGVKLDASVSAEVTLPNVGAGIDPATLTAATVRLVRNRDGVAVPANRNTTGGGDAIVMQPTVLLDQNTVYRFEVTSGLKDVSGAAFQAYTSAFTTGTDTLGGSGPIDARFTKVALANATGQMFTSVTMGPDNKLYAATFDGYIYRFAVNADGTTGTPQVISSVRTASGGPRTILGLAFDPAATATNLVVWITSNEYAFDNATDWTGKVTRLTGSDLQTVQDYVVGLPRSVRDHETNSIAFGPDGALYLTQGSNSATGAADNTWGMRPERVLNAAVLRVNTGAIASPPLNVKSEEGGSYDPFAAGAPVTVYASGVRNAYDLVWHTNGQLYVPTNGSAAGGNTPSTPSPLPAACTKRIDAATRGAYTGPSVPALTNIPSAQVDRLNRVVQGGYYGHPNPKRCEWVLNGGNPTSGADFNEVTPYTAGVQPDRNYRNTSYDMGAHYSPNGVVEYRSSAFGGALRGKLLVVRYSSGDDVVVLTPNATTFDIQTDQAGIPGLTGFVDPLDITEDRRNGNLYVTELGANRITLLRPNESTLNPAMTTSPSRLVFNDVQGAPASAAKSVTIRNEGNGPLSVSSLAIGGADASQFRLQSPPGLPATVAAGSTLQVQVVFDPTSVGPKRATLTVSGNDDANPSDTIALRGLGTLGVGGTNEPSLQWILDTYDIPVNAGDPDPTNNSLPSTPAIIGDEVPLQRLVKAAAGNVTIEPLAVFGPQGGSGEVTSLNWYPVSTGTRTRLFGVANAFYQSLDPTVTGSLSFDPGTGSFGLSTIWPAFANREVFTEDSRNTFTGAIPHHVRAYPLKASDGSTVANSYVVAFEENTSGFDYQDVVAIVRNVRPAGTSSGGEIQVTNLDGVPFPDRLAFSRIGSLASPPSNGVHDRVTVRISNSGNGPLTINSLALTDTFALVTPPALPATIAAGGQLDVTVRFTAESTNVHNGTLTIGSNDTTTPSQVVQLAGYWQSVSEGGVEPQVQSVTGSVMGYKTTIIFNGQSMNRQGRVETVGEEVLSTYWSRADTTKPVSVRQLAAYHTQGNTATIRWHQKGSHGTLNTIFTHAGIDGQTILPRLNQTTLPAAGTFTPSGTFGIKIDSEFTDDALNDQTADRNAGCPGPCGHHVRTWPVRDRAGAIIPNTWIMGMDYSGINYDYNDNIYLISNMKPEFSGTTLHRLDVAGSSNYTDPLGFVWQPDTGLFSPSSAPAEGASTLPLEIDNTFSDPIYQTYRGNTGTLPRTLSYALPTGSATRVDVRLHFAERYSGNNAAGRRVMDILTEGVTRVSGFDIFARAGGLNKAYVLALNDLTTDGTLNLDLRATVDYPSIAGIEVFCRTGC